MQTNAKIRSLLTTGAVVTDRAPSNFSVDQAAVQAIVQAAVDVELFTIPLYMSAMYSIYGSHEINAEGQSYYEGRCWPGLSTTASPSTPNEEAFNTIFSVFIEEMLHLQMAANLAVGVGAQPCFTSKALQDDQHGWTCYGGSSVIPHIVDLQDTQSYKHVTVNLAPLSKDSIDLFLAIEQPEDDAEKELAGATGKYFPSVPFNGWDASKPLPMFGSIGWMYKCLADYLRIQYSDGTTLWRRLVAPLQRDLFNAETPRTHPQREYPRFNTTLTLDTWIDQALDMIDAITDQGEGSRVDRRAEKERLEDVQRKYSPDIDALKADYPSYDSTGAPAPSADAAARDQSRWYMRGEWDHYTRFQRLKEIVQKDHFRTWNQERVRWTPDFFGKDIDGKTSKAIPSRDDLAKAFTQFTEDPSNKDVLNAASVGSIAGITKVLNDYWKTRATAFPGPSMVGSGDRMSIFWAIYGEPPDLSKGLPKRQAAADKNGCTVAHACQGLNLTTRGNDCAQPEVFHTCKGSNDCKGEGGCGFVQSKDGGGGCSYGSAVRRRAPAPAENDLLLYSAPSDNRCGGFGGCAVPISASQLFPRAGTFQLYILDPFRASEPFAKLNFEVGDLVWESAWKAYCAVIEHQGGDTPVKHAPNLLRIILPPST